ncbi:MAG: transglutaminase domain-containing protein [Chloroflexi bacterium]|nr:transglutaminase domain-containing protein [Chloroflexota bacterium]
MTTQASSRRWLGGYIGGGMPPLGGHLRATLRAFLPNLHWVTFFLVLCVVISVVWSLQSAQWTRTPPLHVSAFIGLAVGVALARARINAFVLHSVAFTLWLITVAWLFIGFLNAPAGSQGLRYLGERFGQWMFTARTGGISTDALPFAVTLTVLVWVLGYVAGWFTFRRRNVWVPLVLSGLGLITNISYLPSDYWHYLYLYFFFSLLALSWASFMARRARWEQQHIGHTTALAASGLNYAFWFGLLAIVIALMLPLSWPRPDAFKKAYQVLRWPAETYSGDFHRLFAGVPARKPIAFRTFGDILPFQGPITLGEQVVFTAEVTTPTYFKVHSYPTYISQGWVAGDTKLVAVDWRPGETPFAAYQARQPVVQRVTLQYSPRLLPVGGEVETSDVALLAESPAPPTYTLAIGSNTVINTALPPDVQALARKLASLRFPEPSQPAQNAPGREEAIRASIPDGMVLVSIQRNAQRLPRSVVVQPKLFPSLDTLSLQGQKQLAAGETYAILTSISAARPDELRSAGEDYPAWVSSLYLQLPATLPLRVRDLAASLTASASTPYDKAVAIQEYLEGIPYTLSIPSPAVNSDGVDHFLFVAKAGYSEYYGSALAVMLRAVGVPARLAVGYSFGEVDSEGTVLVRDLNAHGWTEVFFPGYGWVDFEPTPGSSLPGTGAAGEGSLSSDESSPDEDFFDEDLGLPPLGATGSLGGQEGIRLSAAVRLGLLALAILGLTAYGLRAALRWLLGAPLGPLEAYRKLARVAALAGLGPRPGQTPREYGQALGMRLSSFQPQLALLVDAYGRTVFGRQLLSVEEDAAVSQAWRRLRLPLLRQTPGRFRRRRHP